jgi:hypothetical protein
MIIMKKLMVATLNGAGEERAQEFCPTCIQQKITL